MSGARTQSRGSREPWSGGRRAAGRRVPSLGMVLFLLLAASTRVAGAEEATPPADPPPAVNLDQLLRLPKSSAAGSDRGAVGGVSREQWRARYTILKDALADEHRKLDAAMKEVQKIAGDTSSWQMSAPGVGGSASQDAPLSFRLRQEIRQSREEIQRLERSLKDLLIEAELAGVSQEWLTEAAPGEDPASVGSSPVGSSR